jgi:hypothetical protein
MVDSDVYVRVTENISSSGEGKPGILKENVQSGD